jgi:hypothetical protein
MTLYRNRSIKKIFPVYPSEILRLTVKDYIQGNHALEALNSFPNNGLDILNTYYLHGILEHKNMQIIGGAVSETTKNLITKVI